MREEVLRWIICPDCGGELTCHPDERDPSSPHILEGRLSCASCRQNYPIIHGVPRLLPSEAGTRAKNETQEKFGFEWTQFKDYSVDNFTAFIHPLPVGYFTKKLGLDAGCGAGRHSCRAQALGAHMIGLDLKETSSIHLSAPELLTSSTAWAFCNTSRIPREAIYVWCRF
jgi:uncharacterized protein YbaR (Trm112 family)